jgi:hypothetical protein
VLLRVSAGWKTVPAGCRSSRKRGALTRSRGPSSTPIAEAARDSGRNLPDGSRTTAEKGMILDTPPGVIANAAHENLRLLPFPTMDPSAFSWAEKPTVDAVAVEQLSAERNDTRVDRSRSSRRPHAVGELPAMTMLQSTSSVATADAAKVDVSCTLPDERQSFSSRRDATALSSRRPRTAKTSRRPSAHAPTAGAPMSSFCGQRWMNLPNETDARAHKRCRWQAGSQDASKGRAVQ